MEQIAMDGHVTATEERIPMTKKRPQIIELDSKQESVRRESALDIAQVFAERLTLSCCRKLIIE